MKKHIISVMMLVLALAVCSPAGADVIYTNGPIAGNILAWDFSAHTYIRAVADSFVLTSPAVISGFDAGIWVLPGETPDGLTWSILTGGPSWLGGTPVAWASAVSWTSTAYWGTSLPPYAPTSFDIYTATLSGLSVDLTAGTYWLELSRGYTASHHGVFWDENDGPSSAYVYGLGSCGSEAFTVYGTTAPIPGTVWLLGAGLIGLFELRRRFKN